MPEYKRHSNIGYSHERPVCAGCLKVWRNLAGQAPWALIIRGEEPYEFACAVCYEAWRASWVKEDRG